MPAIARLNRFAARRASRWSLPPTRIRRTTPNSASGRHHCVAGTLGQRKAEATLLEKRVVVPNVPCDLAIEGAQQISSRSRLWTFRREEFDWSWNGWERSGLWCTAW